MGERKRGRIKAAGPGYIAAHPHGKRTDRAIAGLEESGGMSAAPEATMHGKGGAARHRLGAEPSRKAGDGKRGPEDGLREKYVLHAASDGETDVTLYSDRRGIEMGTSRSKRPGTDMPTPRPQAARGNDGLNAHTSCIPSI